MQLHCVPGGQVHQLNHLSDWFTTCSPSRMMINPMHGLPKNSIELIKNLKPRHENKLE